MTTRSSILASPCRLPLLATLALALAAAPLAADPVRTFDQAYFAGDATEVDLGMTFGDVTVEGIDGGNIYVEVRISCDREDSSKCQRRANRIRLAARTSGDEFSLDLEGTPRGRAGGLDTELIVKVPREMGVDIDLVGGDIVVRGMHGHVDINSGGGNVDYFGEQDRIRNFEVDLGFGEADLWLRDSHIEGGGFPKAINWTGSGNIDIEIDLAGGNVTAKLE